MKKALFIIAALLTSACAETQNNEEPIVVYRGYDNQGCNYYNGTCYRSQRKYVVSNPQQNQQQVIAYRQAAVEQPSQDYTKTETIGEYKHCSNTIFGNSVPSPKVISSGPKKVVQTAPVQYVEQQPTQYQHVQQQPVQYIRQVQYVQPAQIVAPVTAQVAPCAANNSACQPIVTQTREPVEVTFKKTTTTTVFEPKTTQEVAYEKEPYAGQIPCTNCADTVATAPATTTTTSAVVTSPAVVSVPVTVAKPTVTTLVPVRKTMPAAQMITEIEMDPAEIK